MRKKAKKIKNKNANEIDKSFKKSIIRLQENYLNSYNKKFN